MSRSKALGIDELLSYAVRVGDSIRLQLRLREDSLEPGSATLRLKAGRRAIEAPAELVRDDTGLHLRAAVSGQLGRRPWRLILVQSHEEPPTPLEARLLAAPGLPVALLPGPKPATQMQAPAPRQPVSAPRRLAQRLPEPVKRPLRKGRTLISARARS